MLVRSLSKRFRKSFKRIPSFQKSFRKLNKSEELEVLPKPEIPPIKQGSWRVLITGGAGHLAYHLVQKLVEMICENILQELRNSENPDFFDLDSEVEKRIQDHLQIILLDLIEPPVDMLKHYCAFVKGSFCDVFIMNSLLEHVDTVFHLAAVGMTGQYARDRSMCMDINSTGTMHLINICKTKNVKRFIYTSSVGVIFTGKPLLDSTESETPYPQNWYNYYCESKCHGEQIVRKASTGNFKTTVLRFNGIYGVGEKRVTERALDFIKSGWWIAMATSGGVEAKTQLSSVDNCVQGLLKAELALRHSDCKHGQTYHIMDREQTGTFTFWAPLNLALGYPDKMIVIPGFLFRYAAFYAQTLADYFKVDPFISVLEADLLLTNNTFSIARAQEELDYDPYPSAMPQIIEHYASATSSPNFEAEKLQRKWNFWKKIGISGGILIIVVPILYFLVYPFLVVLLYLNIWTLNLILGTY